MSVRQSMTRLSPCAVAILGFAAFLRLPAPTLAAEKNCQNFNVMETTVCSIVKGETKGPTTGDLSWPNASYDSRTYKYSWIIYEPTSTCRANDIFVARVTSPVFRPLILVKDGNGANLGGSKLQFEKAVDPATGKYLHVAEMNWQCTTNTGPPVLVVTQDEADPPGQYVLTWEVWNRETNDTPVSFGERDCSCTDPASGRHFEPTLGMCDYLPPTGPTDPKWCE